MEPTLDELRARLADDPHDAVAYAALRRALEPSGGRELCELIEKWAERISDPLEQARAYAQAGEQRERLGEVDRAYRGYARALELDPRQFVAAQGFVRIATELRDANRQIEAIERWSAALESANAPARERADAHLALARAYATLPGRLDKAFEHYRAAVALDAELEAVLDEALEKARKARRVQDVRSLLELAATSTRVPERKLGTLQALAEARLAMPTDLDGAIDALRAATELAPEDASLRGQLAECLDRRAQRKRGTDVAARDLAELADLHVETARRSEEAASIAELEQALDRVPNHPVALAMLASIHTLRPLGERYEKRLEAVLRADPHSPMAARARRELAASRASTGRPSEAYALLEPLLVPEADEGVMQEALRAALGAARFADARGLIARLHERSPIEVRMHALRELRDAAMQAGELDAARDAAERMLALAPHDAETLAELDRLYERRGEPLERRAVLERRIALAQDAVLRRALLRSLVELCERDLGEEAAATDAFQRLAELDPRDAATREQLLDRLVRFGRLRAVADIRLWEINHLDTRAERKRSLDALLALHAETPIEAAWVAGALRAYRAKDPDDQDARAALIRLLRGAGELVEATALLREAARAAPDRRARIEALMELAELLEEGLRDDEGAREACLHALELEPGLGAAVERLERMAERGGRRDRVVEAFEHRARMAEGRARADVLTRLAELHEREPVDHDAAIRRWEEVRELDPDDAAAVAALLRLYAETERHPASARLRLELADAADDVETRIEHLRARARLLRDLLHDPDAAADAFRAIRAHREDEEALLASIDHARASGSYAELSSLLETRIAQVDEVTEAIELGMERATLLLDHLGDPRESERELLAVRERDPSFAPALARLAGIYLDEGDALRLAEVTAEHLALTTHPSQRAALAKRLFEIHERSVPDPERALAAAREWAKAAPFDLDALRAVAERLDPERDADELVAVLDARADELLRRIARASTTDVSALRDEALAVLRDSVATTVLHRDAPAHAEARFLRALDLVHRDEDDVSELVRLASELDAHAGDDRLRRAAATYLARKATEVERPVKERLFRRSADLFGGPLADVARAFEVLRRALVECPDDAEILESTVEYGTIGGFEEPLLELLGQCFDASIDAKVARSLQRARADILYDLARYGEAADAYHRLASMEPDNERARARHRECLSRAERYQDLLIALGQSLRRLGGEGGPKRVALLRDVARTWDHGLDDRMEAIDAWKALLAAAPDDAEALAGLERLQGKGSGSAEAATRRSMPPTLASNLSVPPPLPGED